MKVYVIEKGVYSDRHVVAVVETEEEAKIICNGISPYPEEVNYTEYNTRQFATNRLRFHVNEWSNEWEAEYDDYGFYSAYKNNCEESIGSYVIYANSPQQAIKIAQDMKAEKLAKEKGVSL